jgi:hypothetical protein
VLLLLPGFLGAVENQWRRFVKPLERIFSVDFDGFSRARPFRKRRGTSHPFAPVARYQWFAGCFAGGNGACCRIQPGGILRLLLAYNQPQRVSALVVHGTKFYWTRSPWRKCRRKWIRTMIAARVPGYADQLVQDHGARRWRDLVRETAVLVQEMHDEGLAEKNLGGIHAPTLVSVGERDELVTLPEAQRLARKLPDGRLIVLPGVRHPFNSLVNMPFIPMSIHFLQGK